MEETMNVQYTGFIHLVVQWSIILIFDSSWKENVNYHGVGQTTRIDMKTCWPNTIDLSTPTPSGCWVHSPRHKKFQAISIVKFHKYAIFHIQLMHHIPRFKYIFNIYIYIYIYQYMTAPSVDIHINTWTLMKHDRRILVHEIHSAKFSWVPSQWTLGQGPLPRSGAWHLRRLP